MISGTDPFDVFSALSTATSCITVPELAVMLKVSKNDLYAKVKSGSLPGIRIGSSVRLNPKIVADWLTQQTTSKRRR